jgi:hypothetical protein
VCGCGPTVDGAAAAAAADDVEHAFAASGTAAAGCSRNSGATSITAFDQTDTSDVAGMV